MKIQTGQDRIGLDKIIWGETGKNRTGQDRS